MFNGRKVQFYLQHRSSYLTISTLSHATQLDSASVDTITNYVEIKRYLIPVRSSGGAIMSDDSMMNPELVINHKFPEMQNKSSIVGLHDKGKAAILEVEAVSYEKETGEPLCMNRTTVYLRGAGGFSKSSQPYSFSKYPGNQTSSKTPKTRPFVVHEESTQPTQALLYRLSGDYNPLHSDPKVAEVAGFSRPILHGLCTLGFAVRAIIRTICNGDANLVKAISGRFLLHVYPGETLITEMWLEGSRVLYQTKVKERNRAVLAGFVDLNHLRSSFL
ncbi:hypothetical protein L1987_32554 [Smallanthus sonchifolius]|uniref:Uncharacterized protein n=1 Tax=Smallanthus sonchifolius TaxID=185202 RepID=A0ACB9HPR4_9ASTR|nr:hypothetical protein L1987_32554 [Smallanthus sonchifolius]